MNKDLTERGRGNGTYNKGKFNIVFQKMKEHYQLTYDENNKHEITQIISSFNNEHKALVFIHSEGNQPDNVLNILISILHLISYGGLNCFHRISIMNILINAFL